MDYKCFIKFYIAFDNIDTCQAIYYFFKLLDLNDDGYIDAFDINYFYKEIYVKIYLN